MSLNKETKQVKKKFDNFYTSLNQSVWRQEKFIKKQNKLKPCSH